MNVPNILTILRVLLVPTFVSVMIYVDNPIVCGLVAAALFGITSLTDMLDGKIARKYNLVTTFGKVMDPLADKFMVFMAMISLTIKLFMVADTTNDKVLANVTLWVSAIVIFRELAVTSIRLVASSSSGVVIAANWLGKIKTCTQIACVCAVIIEPLIYMIPGLEFMVAYLPLTYLTTALMIIFTLWSGINYIVSYWKYLDPQK